MGKAAKASRVSATFGYDTMEVQGFTLYTVKLRTNQFDLLRFAIEHRRRVLGEIPNVHSRLVEGKNSSKRYAYYEFVTTEADKFRAVRESLDKARAEVKTVEASRLLMGNPWYEPIHISEMRDMLIREESPRYIGNDDSFDDLPF